MQVKELALPGVFLITPDIYTDDRGSFHRSFCTSTLQSFGINASFSQGNISFNPTCFTLRGFHIQLSPHSEAKTFSCVTGSIFDYVVDLRPESPTFLSYVSCELDDISKASLHVPSGCANAWLTTRNNTIVHYYMSAPYVPDSSFGFKYNDPYFNFDWPHQPSLLSFKDLSYPPFNPALFAN